MNASGNWPSTHMTLIGRIADADDTEAWNEFWVTYSPLILRFCQRRQLQFEDAQDVCQNAIQSMRGSLATYDPNKGRFRYWFSQVIRREIIKHRKKQQKAGCGVGGDACFEENLDAEDLDWNEEFNKLIVNNALARIKAEFDDQEWMVMEQVVLRGRKPRDVVSEIGCDAPSISRMKYRLIKRLKEVVQFLADGDLT